MEKDENLSLLLNRGFERGERGAPYMHYDFKSLKKDIYVYAN